MGMTETPGLIGISLMLVYLHGKDKVLLWALMRKHDKLFGNDEYNAALAYGGEVMQQITSL